MAKRKKRREKPAPPYVPTPEPDPREAGRVTLFGEIIDEDATHLKFRVAQSDGAAALGIRGEHWFKKICLLGRGQLDRFDYIRVPYSIAKIKADASPR